MKLIPSYVVIKTPGSPRYAQYRTYGAGITPATPADTTTAAY